jgi:hypothetical protein
VVARGREGGSEAGREGGRASPFVLDEFRELHPTPSLVVGGFKFVLGAPRHRIFIRAFGVPKEGAFDQVGVEERLACLQVPVGQRGGEGVRPRERNTWAWGLHAPSIPSLPPSIPPSLPTWTADPGRR